jgi:hypothetical protein
MPSFVTLTFGATRAFYVGLLILALLEPTFRPIIRILHCALEFYPPAANVDFSGAEYAGVPALLSLQRRTAQALAAEASAGLRLALDITLAEMTPSDLTALFCVETTVACTLPPSFATDTLAGEISTKIGDLIEVDTNVTGTIARSV